jgi:hypothetical protein
MELIDLVGKGDLWDRLLEADSNKLSVSPAGKVRAEDGRSDGES